jgi:hypothetical protein
MAVQKRGLLYTFDRGISSDASAAHNASVQGEQAVDKYVDCAWHPLCGAVGVARKDSHLKKFGYVKHNKNR